MTMVPSSMRSVAAARPPRSVYDSAIGSAELPIGANWWKWSITHSEEKPASSAARAIATAPGKRSPGASRA